MAHRRWHSNDIARLRRTFRPRWTHQAIFFLGVFIRSLTRENEVEDTIAAVLMVDKYGGKDTPGNIVNNCPRLIHQLHVLQGSTTSTTYTTNTRTTTTTTTVTTYADFDIFPQVNFQSFASDTCRQEQRKGSIKSDLQQRELRARMQVKLLQVQQRQRQKQREGANTSDLRQRVLEARAHMQVQQLQVQQRRQKQRKGANTSDLRQRVLEARACMQNPQRQRRRRQQLTNHLLLATGYR